MKSLLWAEFGKKLSPLNTNMMEKMPERMARSSV